MKKMLTLLLTGIMLLSLAATTLAASETPGGKQANGNRAPTKLRSKICKVMTNCYNYARKVRLPGSRLKLINKN